MYYLLYKSFLSEQIISQASIESHKIFSIQITKKLQSIQTTSKVKLEEENSKKKRDMRP